VLNTKIVQNTEEFIKKINELISNTNKTRKVVVENQVSPQKFPEKIEIKNFPKSEVPLLISIVKDLGLRLKAAFTALITNKDPREAIPVRLVDKTGKEFYNALFTVNGGGGGGADMSTVENNTRIPSSIGDGRKVVAAAGVRERLVAVSTPCKYADIMAETDNTGDIVIGGSTVIAAALTRKGIPLYAGQSIRVEFADLYSIYIDSTVNGDGVTFTYYN